MKIKRNQIWKDENEDTLRITGIRKLTITNRKAAALPYPQDAKFVYYTWFDEDGDYETGRTVLEGFEIPYGEVVGFSCEFNFVK